MDQRDTAGLPAGIRLFLRESRGEIIEEWKAAVVNAGPFRDVPPEMLVAHIPELLDRVAGLAEQWRSGEPLESIFGAASRTPVVELDQTTGFTPLLAQLSTLRASIVRVWSRNFSATQDDDLAALHVALDAMIAASISRNEEQSRARFEQLSAQRERALGKLESLLAASPVGIAFVDRDLRYVRINEALAAVSGRPPAEHIGRSVGEMLPNAAPILEPMLRDVLERGEPVINRELVLSSQRNSRAPQSVLLTVFPVRSASQEISGVGAVVSDISDVRRVEEDLRREQARMQSILEHTPAPIWIKDADGRIVLANHQLADALGETYENVIGRRSEDLLPEELAAQHHAHDRIVLSEHRAIEEEEVVPGPHGMRTFVSIKFPLPGDPPMVGAIAMEITDRKRMEEELQLAVRAREQLLAVVSHDLRTPLNTIQLASATLLNLLSGDQRWRRHVETIQRSCLRMDHLIADLLDMASIAAGRLSIEPLPELADEVVREAWELHSPLADEKGIALIHREVVERAPINCDRQRIMQVFANLIGNALKVCRAGDTVTLGGEYAERALRFYVEDTGPGIQPEFLGRLFDPYWSGSNTRSGIGLGLYISRGIIERHGGHIGVQSTVGRGTRFFFDLPLATTPGPEAKHSRAR